MDTTVYGARTAGYYTDLLDAWGIIFEHHYEGSMEIINRQWEKPDEDLWIIRLNNEIQNSEYLSWDILKQGWRKWKPWDIRYLEPRRFGQQVLLNNPDLPARWRGRERLWGAMMSIFSSA